MVVVGGDPFPSPPSRQLKKQSLPFPVSIKLLDPPLSIKNWTPLFFERGGQNSYVHTFLG